ncbi:MAG: AAA family ATPase [Prolixibacteraceae bacterium]|nr:AAA family ATPase [Prolixibacteraceae bacterium]
MYLKQFIIQGYRSIRRLDLTFNKGVNIIIGENNSGKTAIIDALRICLSYGNQFRDIYIDKDKDFYIDINDPSEDARQICFDMIFEYEDPIEAAVFTDFISQDRNDPSIQTIQLHFKYSYETRNDNRVLRWSVWGGDNEGQIVPPEALQLINFTYLSPLRDAVEKLRPHARGNKIAELYKNLKGFKLDDAPDEAEITVLNKEKKVELAKKLQDAVDDAEWNTIIKTGETKVQEHINGASIIGKEPSVAFSFLPYSYDGIINNIEVKSPIPSRDSYFEITQNGLGENNIIYAATVLGDLINNNQGNLAERDHFYEALLIEEPEAHLHPQKQNTFFKYLNTFEEKGLQLFITSHSPTITAKANLDYLIVLQKQKNEIKAFTIGNSELEPENKKYLSKFLDVTKSQLFFSNGTILVEGISEALLLPVFAKKIDLDIDRYGIEIVNIGGVAFEHFARLYNSNESEKRLLAKCSLLTDDDRGVISSGSFRNGTVDKKRAEEIFKALQDNGVIDKLNRIHKSEVGDLVGFEDEEASIVQILSERINKLSERAENAKKFGGKGNLHSHLAKVTFEYELMMASKFNLRLMKLVYTRMHPQTVFLNSVTGMEEQATEILEKLKSNKDKSEFALNLSVILDDEKKCHLLKRFEIPKYIKDSIQWVIPQ